ncbi:Dirigent protein 18 [Asimina triloba]
MHSKSFTSPTASLESPNNSTSIFLYFNTRSFCAAHYKIFIQTHSNMFSNRSSAYLSFLAFIIYAHMAGPLAAAATADDAGPATPAAAGDHVEPTLELYMHDILGGSSPTARPITGLLGNIYNGQVPFARPVGFIPPKGGVPIPNANGAIPTVIGSNGIPLGTGLSGTSFVPTPNGPAAAAAAAANSQAQLGPDGLAIGFGTITVIDDVLTMGPDLGSQAIGKAQGVYVASSADGVTQMMAFTAMMEGGEYGDSLNFFGVYKVGSAVSGLSVTGGTGKFKNACGFAEVRSLFPTAQHVTDGAETLLRITVHLTY